MKIDYELKEELRKIISETTKETLVQLGIASHEPLEVQKDMQHLREWRRSMESIRSKSMLTVISLVVSGSAACLWLGLKMLVVR